MDGRWGRGVERISTVSVLQNYSELFRGVGVSKNSPASLRIQHGFLLQLVFPDLVVERHAVDPEDMGGPDDVPPVLLEDLANMLLLHFGEGLAAAVGCTGHPGRARQGPVGGGGPGAPRAGGGRLRSASRIILPFVTTIALSITFRNSRAFPGQSCSMSRRMADSATPSTFFPISLLNRSRKCSTSRGISSFLSRRGGMWIDMTFSR